MNKRGQLTIFMLLGLVLVITVALILSIRQPSTIDTALRPDSIQAAERALYDCWDQSAQRVITRIGVHGGTMLPEIINVNDSVRAAVLDNTTLVPTPRELGREISYASGLFSSRCEQQIVEAAARQGVTVELGALQVYTRVYPTSTIVAFRAQHRISDDTSSHTIEPHTYTAQTSLGKLTAFAWYIAERFVQTGNLDLIPVTANGVDVTVYPGPSGVSAVSLISVEQPPGMTAVYVVAFDQRTDTLPDEPVVRPLAPLTAPVGQQTLGVVLAQDPQGGPLSYRSLDPMTYIDPDTGAYSILPSEEDIGQRAVSFLITNQRGVAVLTSMVVQVV